MGMRKQAVEQDVWELALERMRTTYEMSDEVIVSFSGGKDSTVCLHAALEVAKELNRLPLKVVFYDEEAIPPETIDYVARVAARPDVDFHWYCLPVKHRNACSRKHPYWHPWAPEDEAKWCRPLPPTAITTVPGFNRGTIPESNWMLCDPRKVTGMILGMAARESLRRYMAVTHRSYNNFISYDSKSSQVLMSKPIYDWSGEDVWTAPKRFGWDFNHSYDTMTKAGVSRYHQRVCPPYGEEPVQRLWTYAQCWPELWEKMCARVPGAATAARYSRSPLYGCQGLEGWDSLKDPQEMIQSAINKWPEDLRPKIASRIEREIRNHYSKTDDTISLEDIPNENFDTGVTWKYLYMLAIRGDFKGRRKPNIKRIVK